MKKLSLLIVFGCFFVGILFLAFLHPTKKPTATIDHHTFSIEIAQTPQQQEIGLAKYASLPKNNAMYFPFNRPDYYTFWMKGMHFPIDMLFVRNNKVVTIFSNVMAKPDYQNYIYKPTQPSDAVLEINAGLSQQYGFQLGDTVIIDK